MYVCMYASVSVSLSACLFIFSKANEKVYLVNWNLKLDEI